MLTILDRSLIRNYLKAYVICVVSLVSLFIVVDLFTNLDDFSQGRKGFSHVLRDIGVYYSYKVMQVFDQLCEGLLLVAAMFTVSLVQRHNELMPVLSAGVSTRRLVRPVLLSALAMLSLTVLNQELVLPNVDSFVLENRRDMEGKKDVAISNTYDGDTLITGKQANRSQQTVKDFLCIIPDRTGHDSPTRMEAKEAKYVPPGEGPRTGGFLLTGTRPAEMDDAVQPAVLEKIVSGKYFLYTEDVDFDALTRQKNWWQFLGTLALLDEMGKPGNSKLANLAVVFHMRLTRPILGMILIFLGLSIILHDQNRNVFISAGLCLLLCAIFFMSNFFCKNLGDNEYLSPALAAWMPVLVFGPLTFVMFDAIHT